MPSNQNNQQNNQDGRKTTQQDQSGSGRKTGQQDQSSSDSNRIQQGEGNRPAKPGDDGSTIVGQTLEQARENGKIGGQIVKEAVERGMKSQDDESSTVSSRNQQSTGSKSK